MKFVKRDINYYNRIVMKIPFLAILGLEFVAALLSLLHIATQIWKEIPEGVVYVIYVVAACALFLLVWRIILIVKDHQWNQKKLEMIHRWSFLGKMADDFTYRTVTMAGVSFIINMLFAITKGVVGWFSVSFWMITFAAYYLVLSLSKLILLSSNFKLRKIGDTEKREIREWKAYRVCGILLMLLTIVLQGMVVLVIKTDSRFVYQEKLLLLIATVDFYCLISSIIYMVRNRGVHTPIIAAIKNISFASSLVSIFSLQIAMFAAYEANTDLKQKNLMNLLTGSAVCIMLLAFGGHMVWNAKKNIKRLKR